MPITVTIDIEPADKFLLWLYRDQIPFATSQAINKTALQGQTEVRQNLDRSFTLRRRDWAHRNVYIGRQDFAKKTKLQARVSIKAPGDGSRSDILAKFEEGGEKRPRGKHLAIPRDLKRTGSGIIPRSMRPRAFNFKPQAKGKVFSGKGRRAGRTNVYLGDKRTFMIVHPDGTGGIYQRVGVKLGRGRRKYYGPRLASDIATRKVRDLNIRTLYRFTPEAHIDSRLHFEETVKGVVRVRFSANFQEAFAKAIAGGRGRLNTKTGMVDISLEVRRIAKADLINLDRAPRRRR